MKPRPKREDVIAALHTLIDADAISLRHALDIAYDAATVVGIETGEERERQRAKTAVSAEQLQRIGMVTAR